MSVLLNLVRKSFYLDSVALMRLSRRIAGMPGVIEAALMMGTPANRQIMQEAGLLDARAKPPPATISSSPCAPEPGGGR